eukprot:COSAG01_NODE_28642_length_656_cov_1.260323_2_plen_33_part_01
MYVNLSQNGNLKGRNGRRTSAGANPSTSAAARA